MELQDALLHAAGWVQWLGQSKKQTEPCPHALFLLLSGESYSVWSPCRAFQKRRRRLYSLPSPSQTIVSQKSSMIQPNIHPDTELFLCLILCGSLSQSSPIVLHESIYRVRFVPSEEKTAMIFLSIN